MLQLCQQHSCFAPVAWQCCLTLSRVLPPAVLPCGCSGCVAILCYMLTLSPVLPVGVCLSAMQREKEASGLADVPGGSKGKLLEVEYAFTEDRKLRGQLRDPSAIEAQVRAACSQRKTGRCVWCGILHADGAAGPRLVAVC